MVYVLNTSSYDSGKLVAYIKKGELLNVFNSDSSHASIGLVSNLFEGKLTILTQEIL